jgi:hypothetical protein
MALLKDTILQYSGFTFTFGSATYLEEQVITEIKTFFSRLTQRDVFSDILQGLEVNSVFNKEMSRPHQITVEAIPREAMETGFGRNASKEVDDAGNLWVLYGGKWIYNISVTVRSMNRSTVAKLADIVMIGMQLPITKKLLEIGIDIPINNMTFDRIIPEGPGYENFFRLVLRFNNVGVDWKQIYTENGEICKEVDGEITLI